LGSKNRVQELSAAAADTLDPGRQQLVAVVRRRFDVCIIAVTLASRE
jgi:hypothetical protein